MNARIAFRSCLLFAIVALLAAGCADTTPTPPATATPGPPNPMGAANVTVNPQPTSNAKSPQAKTELAMSQIERLPGQVLARVNGQEITWEDFEPVLRQTLFNISGSYDINWADAAMKQRLLHLENEALKQAADQVLLQQMAEAQGLTPKPADVQAVVDGEKGKILSSGRYADWPAFLQANGLTDETFARTIADTLLLTALLAAQQVESQAEQVHLRHIALDSQATADKVMARLKAGEDFAALAAEYSLDTETKNNGGDLGWFLPDGIIPELKDTALSLNPGEVAGPLQTSRGLVIVQVVERGMHDLEPVMVRQMQQQALMARLDEMRAAAEIEYLIDFAATPTPAP